MTGPVNGVQVWRLPVINRRPLTGLSYLVALMFFLLTRLSRFDLVCVHLAYFQADIAVIAGRLHRRPVWVKLAASGPHGEIQRMRRLAVITRYLGIRGATRVQATSEAIASEAMSIGVAEHRIVRIPNGVDTNVFRPVGTDTKQRLRNDLGLPAVGTIVLFVGRMALHKGIRDLLEAWRDLPKTSATLMLVGSFATMDVVDMPQASDGIVVRDWTPRVADYYGSADLFVLPSHTEGMSNAMLEAMACGLPPICTRVGAAESVIEHEVNGLLVPPGQPTLLASALRSLIDDPAACRRLGAAAVATVQQNYSIRRVVGMLETEYSVITTAG
jgi:glycosyltransferase involved in cell wall biosynthesis